MVTLATSRSSPCIENQEDKNDKTAITPAQASPFSTLPVEILPIIFQFAAGSNQPKDLQTLLSIRLVCKQWKNVMHNKSVLNTYWKIIKNIPSFQPPSIYAQKIQESENPPARPEISAEDQNSALWKFKNFSNALGASRALILPCDYEQYLQDESLKKIWSRIQKKIGFGAALVPQEAQEIRSWLNDPANTAALETITGLNLSNLKLEVLPPEIGNLKKLSQLYLDKNQLTTLPDTIGNLKELEKLYLDNNQFRTLPGTIGNLKKLKTLYLDNNQFRTLPGTIGNLKELKTLYLDNNQLTALPNTIGNLKELKTLHLYSNQLTTLPDTIGKLSQLSELCLDRTLRTTLPSYNAVIYL